MAGDARTIFIDGMRVTADHMDHLQARLQEAVRDVRRVVGLRRVAWGLHVSVQGSTVTVEPGVAFAPSGVRLNVDSLVQVNLPAGAPPFRVTLKAVEKDRAALRVGDQPTLMQLQTSAAIEPGGAPDPGADALVIARLETVSGALAAVQDLTLFAAPGYHAHSGKFVAGPDGTLCFDGPALNGEPGPKGDKGDTGDKGDKGDPGDKGANGAKGAKGDKGDAGDAGAKGDPGNAGAKGDKGDPGNAGAKGDKGDPGAKGDKGDPGNAGAKGDKGDAGNAGAKGDKGDAGDAGAKGDPGNAGAKGDKGDAGNAGAKGDKGDPGNAGAKGDKGDPGAKGDKGDPGNAGAKGDKGDAGNAGAKGDKGDPGNAGAKGDKGDKGDPGAGVDLNVTMVGRVPWKQGDSLAFPAGLTFLTSPIVVTFTGALLLDTAQPVQQAMEVWVHSTTLNASVAPPAIIALHGNVAFGASDMTWTPTDPAASTRVLIANGGRVTIRIHCGFIYDRSKKPVSACLNAVAAFPNPVPVPGGVFESWLFIKGG